MPRRRVSDPIATAELAAAERAMAELAMPGHVIAGAERYVEPTPGLYAVHASRTVWDDLGLEPRDSAVPLYVGKAEVSMVSRDIRTHFATGRTGSSTVRRSFAALLREHLGLRALPRNPLNPEGFSNFGLSPEQDAKLTDWMRESLRLSTWVKEPASLLLIDVEAVVIRTWAPPVNIDENPRRLARLSRGRAMMAAQAREWAIDHGDIG